jgi:hypothetical protein
VLQRNKPTEKPIIPQGQPSTTINSAEGTAPFVRPNVAGETPTSGVYHVDDNLPPVTESASPNAPQQWANDPTANFGQGLQFQGTVGTGAEGMRQSTTSYKHQLSKEEYYVNPGLYVEGAASEIEDPLLKCPYHLTQAELEAYGINTETHVHCWLRNPLQNGLTRYDTGDRVQQWMRQKARGEDRRPVLINGRFVENDQLVLCIKSKPDLVQEERRSTAAAMDYVGKADMDGYGEFEDPLRTAENLRRMDQTDQMERQRMANRDHERNVEMGLIGKTDHLNWYEEMEKPEGMARALKTEDQFRGVRMDHLTREHRATLDALVELKQERRLAGLSTRVTVDDLPQRKRTAPGTKVSVGNSGFPNPLQKRFAGSK